MRFARLVLPGAAFASPITTRTVTSLSFPSPLTAYRSPVAAIIALTALSFPSPFAAYASPVATITVLALLSAVATIT
ncbi:hypothetical protein PC110_g21938, partial [Phytophthora cactorum]